MAITRRLRRWVSSGMLMAMLFMQLATAAYACPWLKMAGETGAAMSMMRGCNGAPAQMDGAQPQLCKASCDADAQNMGSVNAPELQPNPAAMTLLFGFVEPLEPPPPREAAPGHGPSLPRPPGLPPLYLTLLVLRN